MSGSLLVLMDHEKVLEDATASEDDRAWALREIEQRRLYVHAGCETFDEYLTRWGLR